MSKQTAVEWLETELKKLPMVNVVKVFKEAKAMEKEQILDAFDRGFMDMPYNANAYYKKTYKGGQDE